MGRRPTYCPHRTLFAYIVEDEHRLCRPHEHRMDTKEAACLACGFIGKPHYGGGPYNGSMKLPRHKPDYRTLSVAFEHLTGSDSIPTIERVYNQGRQARYACCWPGCGQEYDDAEEMWRHVHMLTPVHLREATDETTAFPELPDASWTSAFLSNEDHNERKTAVLWAINEALNPSQELPTTVTTEPTFDSECKEHWPEACPVEAHIDLEALDVTLTALEREALWFARTSEDGPWHHLGRGTDRITACGKKDPFLLITDKVPRDRSLLCGQGGCVNAFTRQGLKADRTVERDALQEQMDHQRAMSGDTRDHARIVTDFGRTVVADVEAPPTPHPTYYHKSAPNGGNACGAPLAVGDYAIGPVPCPTCWPPEAPDRGTVETYLEVDAILWKARERYKYSLRDPVAPEGSPDRCLDQMLSESLSTAQRALRVHAHARIGEWPKAVS